MPCLGVVAGAAAGTVDDSDSKPGAGAADDDGLKKMLFYLWGTLAPTGSDLLCL